MGGRCPSYIFSLVEARLAVPATEVKVRETDFHGKTCDYHQITCLVAFWAKGWRKFSAAALGGVLIISLNRRPHRRNTGANGFLGSNFPKNSAQKRILQEPQLTTDR